MAKRFTILLAILMAQGWVPFELAVQKQFAAETQTARSASSIFKEVAEQTGLKFQHYNGMTGKLYLPEITGSGAALFDFDNDGDLDLFLVQGNVLEPNSKPESTQFPWRGTEPPRGRLFRNDLVVGKDGTRTLHFTDVTEKSGIMAGGYGMGVAGWGHKNQGLAGPLLSRLRSKQNDLDQKRPDLSCDTQEYEDS